jgi:sulfite exporter TauE/SafE
MGGFFGAMFLLGLASGLHCVGMCGGIVGAFSTRQVLHSRKSLLIRQFSFNAGRIASYAAAGALAGLAGSVAAYAGVVLPAQAGLYVLANVVLVLVALHIAGIGNPLRSIERFGLPLWKKVHSFAARLIAAQGKLNAFGAGAMWGWLPCGLVYGALAAAAFAGSPGRGALAMAAFGLGTLPYLLAAGLAAARLRSFMHLRAVRLCAAGALLGFGSFGLARASGLADAVHKGLLCL